MADRALSFTSKLPAETRREKIILPEGDYVFQVSDYKETIQPADPANGIDDEYTMCEIGLRINHQGQNVWVNMRLKILKSKLPRIMQFLQAIGLKKPDEECDLIKIRECMGCKGMAHISLSDDKMFNNVKYFKSRRDYEAAEEATKTVKFEKVEEEDDEEVPF